MCGICGIVNMKNGPMPSEESIKDMLGTLVHRGPDSCGYYRDNKTALGHSRLAIIDLETGIQPLSNENGTIWITFNGEIYNYLELRKELIAKGHIFKTRSDTETIIHSWEEWGTDCFNKFNGQWALALWDAKTDTLVLSRDRLGIRPLYYTEAEGQLIFASEVKAIFANKMVERKFCSKGLKELFTFWSPVAPQSVFENILEIQPGHYAVTRNGRTNSSPYWNLDFPEEGVVKSWDSCLEELKETLISSARLRFERSDVTVGAYLSGGLDSSITSTIVSRYANSGLKTYSLRFSDDEFDEGCFQNEMAQKLGTAHREIKIGYRDIGNIFPEVIYHTERPILRTAPAPLFLLSKLVRESGCKVVVTGEGADEVLAGYDIFREAKVRKKIAMNPDSPENEKLVTRLYPWMKRTPGKAPAFAKAFFSRDLDINDPALSHRPRWNTTSTVLRLLSTETKERMSSFNVAEDMTKRLPSGHTRWDDLSRAQWFEYKTLLSGYILSAQGDRMLMGNSIEGRFPFLDHRLVELANKLPAEYKLKDLSEKHILKEAFRDVIPDDIISRPKQPYRSPDAVSFFNGEKYDWLDELSDPDTLKEAGIFNPAAVEKLFNKCRKRKGRDMSNSDNMMTTAVISTMLTHGKFIKNAPKAQRSLPEISVFDYTV